MGAQMLRTAAERTGQLVGDGTSTATVLAHAILVEGVRNIAAGASAQGLQTTNLGEHRAPVFSGHSLTGKAAAQQSTPDEQRS